MEGQAMRVQGVDSSARRRRRGRRWWLVAASAALATVAVVIPGLSRARIASNETAAIGTLRSLSTAMAQAQSSGWRDADGNGTGEFVFLSELDLALEVPGPDASRDASRPSMIESLASSARAGLGIARRSGYCFLLYLPTAAGTAVEDDGATSSACVADALLREQRFAVYAWPERVGRTGNRAFVVTQQGEVFSAANQGKSPYEGSRHPPRPGAAFVIDAPASGIADNLEGQLVTGPPASDGQQWLPAG
jgi:hypothetical protein